MTSTMTATKTAKKAKRQSNAILSMAKARKIREMFVDGELIADIAGEYGVSKACIQHVLNGETWKETAR
jgi:uncharacterized protein YjcR